MSPQTQILHPGLLSTELCPPQVYMLKPESQVWSHWEMAFWGGGGEDS